MPLLTAITTVCTKMATGAVMCTVGVLTDIPYDGTQVECTRYYEGYTEGVMRFATEELVYAKAECVTPNYGKMIVSALPGSFEKEGWLYTLKVKNYGQ
jgi:hypothetical protein